MPSKVFPVWKRLVFDPRIRIADGLKNSIDDLNRGLAEKDKKKIRLSENAVEVLGRPGFSFAVRRMSVELVKVSLAQLDLGAKASRGAVHLRALSFGLRECVPDLGPQLRVHYSDQPENERLVIGMEPIRACGFQDVFLLDSDANTLWLRAVPGSPNGLFDNEFKWVFVSPPPTPLPAKRLAPSASVAPPEK